MGQVDTTRLVAATTLYLDYPSSWNSENCLVTLSSLNYQRSTKYLIIQNAGLLFKMIIQVINLLMISLSNTIITKAFTENNVVLTHNWCTDS